MSKNITNKISTLYNKPIIRVIACFIIIAAIFAVMFDLNRLFPIYIDDWDYSFVYYTNDWLNSIFDVIPSMKTHYTMWGGRLVVHTILQEMLLFGSPWNDLLNSLMFAGYILLIYFIANKGKTIRPSLIFVIFFLTWFFQADMGESTLWLTGSANYLWGTSIILAFLYPYYSYYINNFYTPTTHDMYEVKDGKLRCVLFFFFGLIAGWTNENMVVALGFMIVVFLFIVWKTKHKIAKWTIWGLAGMCLGALLMLIAPGNFKRLKIEYGIRGIEGKPGIDYYLENLQTLFDGIIHYLLIPFIIYIVLIGIYLFLGKQENKRERLVTSFIFLAGFFVATFAMVASPVFPPRAWFGVITLAVIAIVVIYAGINFSKIYIRGLVWICILFGCVMFVKTYTEGRGELVRIRAIVDNRESQINEQKAQGKRDVVIKTEKFEKRDDLIIPKIYDFPEDTTLWMFQAYKHYHELNTIRVIEK